MSFGPIIHGRYDDVRQRAQSHRGALSLNAAEIDFLVRRALRSRAASREGLPVGYEHMSDAEWERYVDTAPPEDLMGIPIEKAGTVASLRIVHARHDEGGSAWVGPPFLLNQVGAALGIALGPGTSSGKAKFLPREFFDADAVPLSFPRLNLVVLGETTDGRSFLLCLTFVDTPSWPWAPYLWTAAMPQDHEFVFLPEF